MSPSVGHQRSVYLRYMRGVLPPFGSGALFSTVAVVLKYATDGEHHSVVSPSPDGVRAVTNMEHRISGSGFEVSSSIVSLSDGPASCQTSPRLYPAAVNIVTLDKEVSAICHTLELIGEKCRVFQGYPHDSAVDEGSPPLLDVVLARVADLVVKDGTTCFRRHRVGPSGC